MSTMLRATSKLLTWNGALSLQREPDQVMPWRIPYEQRDLFWAPGLLQRAAMPAGVRICFRSNTDLLIGCVEPDADATAVDLVCDDEVVASVRMAGKDAFQFADLPKGLKRIEVWLPQFGTFKLRQLQFSRGATVSRWAPRGKRWVAYGSSITQCRTAASPTQTWPAIVARQMKLDLTCLGFGGNCHAEPMVARLIRDLPADYLSLCIGINIYGNSSLNLRTFRPAVLGFIQIIRERHKKTPLVLMSPIYSPNRETTPNSVGLTLQSMRQELYAAVQTLRNLGDRHVHYVDGLEILSEADAAHLPDGLHPDAQGYRIMAQNYLKKVAAIAT
jgi:lysophospholipase L1-like esterase